MANVKEVLRQKGTIVYIIIFLLGIGIMCYPAVSSMWNAYVEKGTITAYQETVASGKTDNEKQLEMAEAYNANLQPAKVPDAFSIRDKIRDKGYEEILSLYGEGVMGYVSVPAIDVELPIYHYTNEESLKKGAGHLLGSSLPVGGKNTHAVISAHRGLPNAKMFRDLNAVQIGDAFYVSVAGREMKYEVDRIDIVKPDQTESLARDPEQDLVTLVTCTPYGINTHRLLVRGHRVPNDGVKDSAKPNRTMLFMIIGSLLAGILLAVIINYIMNRKKSNKKTRRPQDGRYRR